MGQRVGSLRAGLLADEALTFTFVFISEVGDIPEEFVQREAFVFFEIPQETIALHHDKEK